MADNHPNFGASLVVTPPSPATSGTSLVVTLDEGALFGTGNFNAVICPSDSPPTHANAEIVRVQSVAGDTLQIVRAQELSSARTVLAGDQIFAAITKKTLTDIEVGAPAPGTFQMRSTAAAAMTTVFAKIPLGTADFDLSGWCSGGKFTPQQAGYYQVNAGVASWAAGLANGDVIQLGIMKNGSLLPGGAGNGSFAVGSTGGVGLQPSLSALVYCNGTTDYVELWGACSTSTWTTVATAATCWMDGFLSTVQPPNSATGTGVFEASASTSVQLGVGTPTFSSSKLLIDTVDYDLSGWFDTANKRFTPKQAGYYQINAGVQETGVALADGDALTVQIQKNGSSLYQGAGSISVEKGGGNGGLRANVSSLVYLNGTTDYVELWGSCYTAAFATVTTQFYGWMNGYLATATSTSAPSGPAGGDLVGTYPNPTLSTQGSQKSLQLSSPKQQRFAGPYQVNISVTPGGNNIGTITHSLGIVGAYDVLGYVQDSGSAGQWIGWQVEAMNTNDFRIRAQNFDTVNAHAGAWRMFVVY